MTKTKNQIRPRRFKFHFLNAELLALDTTGFVELVAPAPLGQCLVINELQVRTNIVQVYSGLDSGINLFFTDDFGQQGWLFDTAVGDLTSLLATTGLNLISNIGPGMAPISTAGNVIAPYLSFNWTDEAEIVSDGGIFLVFDNGGSDLGGGDPLNYMDVFLSYSIVNL